ncbi:response regulator transcription factor [Rubritalea tangerina]|uniref:Response regulator transcription factor n=2 Tax=Rubritalea tangerina TaxID=430798 RepID=A0ABW4Z827_9BACT
MRILLVEDNGPLRGTLEEALSEEGYLVDACEDGEVGLYHAREISYDLVILDVMLPKMNGWEVLETLRKEGKEVPVLMLTARDSTEDRVRGLDSGADDYLVKPFKLAELTARMRSLLRRSRGQSQNVVRVGDVTIDASKKEIQKAGELVDVTALEYRMVDTLVAQRGKVVSRAFLYEHLFSEEKEVVSNILEVYVCNLRKKLGGDFVKTKRGHGYFVE